MRGQRRVQLGIDAAQLEALARPMAGNAYGQYLLKLLGDKVY